MATRGTTEEARGLSHALPAWASESFGWAVAVLLALVAVAHLDATDRSWMLYYDPETVLPALVRGSVLAGQPQEWALSAVLFIPEMGLYFALAAIGLGVKGTFALNAFVNFLLFYGALRLLSGSVRHGTSRVRARAHRVAGALVAFAAVVALVLLEDSSGWDTLELVSLLATSTFYSMTVVASTVTTGLAVRVIRDPTRRRRWLEAALLAVSALSTLTNPLYAAWEVAPLAVVFALVGWRRVVGWWPLVRVTAILGLGVVVGLLARIPFGALITKDGPAYANPGLAGGTALFYAVRLAERASSVPGAISVTFAAAFVAACGILFRRSVGRRDAPAAILAGMGWVAPAAVMLGAVLLGAVGTRYVQPVFFAPLGLLVLAPEFFARRAGRPRTHAPRLSPRGVRALLAVAAVVCLAASSVLTATLGRSATAVSADVRGVDAWVTASHRTGAGRYWTIRGPKAYLAEPASLIQVDDSFNAYPWLTDRADYTRNAVSFVVSDDRYPPPALPAAARDAPRQTVSCGQYTITDFGADVLPIGPPQAGAKP